MGSIFFTVICLFGILILVFMGTLLQLKMDIHQVEALLFRPFFLWWHGVPIFLGGAGFASLLLINLIVSFWKHRYWRNMALSLIHAGFALLIAGEVLRMLYTHESYMVLRQGESLNYSENPNQLELAIITGDSLDPDEIFRVGLDGTEQEVSTPDGTLSLKLRNTTYEVAGYGVKPLVEGTQRIGSYEVAIRPERIYYPFTFLLAAFEHETHPGTEIPKSFKSTIKILDETGKHDRTVEITMNKPLYYQRKTFYQSSYGDTSSISVLHIVANKWKYLPYLSLGMIASGLLLHTFKMFRRKR